MGYFASTFAGFRYFAITFAVFFILDKNHLFTKAGGISSLFILN